MDTIIALSEAIWIVAFLIGIIFLVGATIYESLRPSSHKPSAPIMNESERKMAAVLLKASETSLDLDLTALEISAKMSEVADKYSESKDPFDVCAAQRIGETPET